MGQKVNCKSFRINYEKQHQISRYLPKDKEEHSTYTFKNVEIENYLNNILRVFGLLVHNTTLCFTMNQLKISSAYYLTIKGQKFFKSSGVFLKTVDKKPRKNFTEILLESLSSVTYFKLKIFITLFNLNKQLLIKLSKFSIRAIKKKIFQLREFSKTYFFNQTINIILIIIRLKNSAKLLTDFLILQLKRFKKQNYFLFFFKRALLFFLKCSLSRIRGIKLVINGRIRKLPRASSKKILIGNMPLSSIMADINYNKNTLFTINGSIGVNVWIF